MKTQFISRFTILVILSILLFTNINILLAQTKDEKRRMKIIQKSSDKKSAEIFMDTVYYCGKPAYLLKSIPHKVNIDSLASLCTSSNGTYLEDKYHYLYLQQPKKKDKLFSLSNQKLFDLELANVRTSSTALQLLQGHRFLFWLKFEGTNSQVRYFSKGSYADLIQEMIENGMLKDGGLNNSSLDKFVEQNKASKIYYQLENQCPLNSNIVVKNNNGDIIENYSLAANTSSLTSSVEWHEAAIGDRICVVDDKGNPILDNNGNPIHWITINADNLKIIVNSYCAGIYAQ